MIFLQNTPKNSYHKLIINSKLNPPSDFVYYSKLCGIDTCTSPHSHVNENKSINATVFLFRISGKKSELHNTRFSKSILELLKPSKKIFDVTNVRRSCGDYMTRVVFNNHRASTLKQGSKLHTRLAIYLSVFTLFVTENMK